MLVHLSKEEVAQCNVFDHAVANKSLICPGSLGGRGSRAILAGSKKPSHHGSKEVLLSAWDA